MVHRRDFGATDIARQSAEVLITVASFLARLMLVTAVVCFSVVTVMGLHAHVVVAPNLWVHHLGVGGSAGSLRHLIVMLTVGFIAVRLEAFVLCRDASARREPSPLCSLPPDGSSSEPGARNCSSSDRLRCDPQAPSSAIGTAASSVSSALPSRSRPWVLPRPSLSARTLGVSSDSQVIERRSAQPHSPCRKKG